MLNKNANLIVFGGFLLAGLALVAVTIVSAGQRTASADPPGNDGVCQHGNSGLPCRPDPQPDHGKDCDPHGANFDGNEDHCKDKKDEKTPTSTPETPTSTPETPTSTPETPTSTPETPTASPETPSPTAMESVLTIATETPTTAAVAGLVATPTEEAAVLSVEPIEEVEAVAALPATGSGGPRLSFAHKLAAGLGIMLLGALLGLSGIFLDSRRRDG